METKRLVDTLDDNLSQEKAERHWDILGEVKAEALADPMAVTLAEVRAETVDKMNSYTVEEAVANRFGDTSAMWSPRHLSIR